MSAKQGRAIFKPKARIIKLLGEELIPNEVIALFELVKNAYDADATKVEVILENISDINLINLPCSGKLNVPYLVKTFETGADGVLIITCEQEQCKNVEGNKRAIKRAEAIDSLNEEIGLGRGRIDVIQVEEGQENNVAKQIKEFCVSLNKIKAEFVTVRGAR